MKKIILIICLIFLMTSAVFADGVVLTGGVSISKVPKALFGEWRVTSDLISTNSPQTFKNESLDLWNLSKVGNVVTLENPFSGAKSSVVVNSVKGNVINFKKTGRYDGKILLDIVQLTLQGDKFSGTDSIELKTFSSDGDILKRERAIYKIYGEKIAGSNIIK